MSDEDRMAVASGWCIAGQHEDCCEYFPTIKPCPCSCHDVDLIW